MVIDRGQMAITLSKSQFKPKVLAYLRRVEETGEEIIITDHGRPVARIQQIREEASLDAIKAHWSRRLAEGRARYDPDEGTRPLPPDDWGVFGETT